MTEPVLDCLIVGAGPAGLTTAVYLQRFHRKLQVLDSAEARALRIDRSHNVPGFPDGVGGAELLGRMRQQLQRFGGEVLAARMVSVQRRADGGFRAQGDGGRIWEARFLLLATGAHDRDPEVPGIQALRARGLLRECPICDGYEHTGRRMVVVGADAHAVREALFLRHFSEQVLLLRLPPHPAQPLAQESQRQLRDHSIPWKEARLRSARVEGDTVCLVLGTGETLRCDVLYSALGSEPRAEWACALGARCDSAGNVTVDAHGRTQVTGLYAAGDVTGGLDQIVVAMAQGALAATDIHNALRQAVQDR
jgi:thioredoxin reductase (NADPH)